MPNKKQQREADLQRPGTLCAQQGLYVWPLTLVWCNVWTLKPVSATPGPFSHTSESRRVSKAHHLSPGIIQRLSGTEIRRGFASTGHGTLWISLGNSNARLTPINAKQFLQSLINNMKKRLSFEGELLCDLSVLDSDTWPSRPGIRPGELQVTRLCRRFSLSEEQAVMGCDGMRDFLEHPDREPQSLKPLIRCMQTIPCSTAECERGFRLH